MDLTRTASIALAGAAALFLLAELIAHVARPTPYMLDRKLGWRLKQSFQHAFVQADQLGNTYVADFRTDSHGLRIHGRDSPNAFRILAIGDSFTADPHAGNAAMWYSVMADAIAGRMKRDVFVAAAGGGGFGTLQELLLVREIAAYYTPDLLILQFCSNDFVNNHKEWESLGPARSIYMRRPYFQAPQGTTYDESSLALLYRSPWIGESRVLNKLDSLYQALYYKLYGNYSLRLPPEMLRRFERESWEITTQLLRQVRAVYPNTPALMVNCDSSSDGPNRDWMKLALDTGYVPASAPSDAVAKAKDDGKPAFTADGHWSPVGQTIYGMALVEPALKLVGTNRVAR